MEYCVYVGRIKILTHFVLQIPGFMALILPWVYYLGWGMLLNWGGAVLEERAYDTQGVLMLGRSGCRQEDSAKPSDSKPEWPEGRRWRCRVPEPPGRQCSVLSTTDLEWATCSTDLVVFAFTPWTSQLCLGKCPYALLCWAVACSVSEPALEFVNKLQQSLDLLSITLQSPVAQRKSITECFSPLC